MQSIAMSTPLQMSRTAALAGPAGPRHTAARRSSLIVARVAPPKGVSQPPVQPLAQKPLFGFVDNAEKWNSRAAMVRRAPVPAAAALLDCARCWIHFLCCRSCAHSLQPWNFL